MPDAVARFRRRRFFLYALLTMVLIFGALASFAGLLLWRDSPIGEDLFITLLLTGGFGVTSFGCLPAWSRPSWRVIVVLGFVLSAMSLCACIMCVWGPRWYRWEWQDLQRWEQVAGAGAAASGLAFYLCLTTLARVSRRGEWLRFGTRLVSSGLAAWISAIVLFEIRTRVGAPPLIALLILTSCGTLALIIAHCVGTLQRPEHSVTTRLALTLTCPRCGLSQELPAGRSACRACGLVLRIEIEEEHCAACGYLLYRLTSDRCPECGATIFQRGGTAAPPLPSTDALDPSIP